MHQFKLFCLSLITLLVSSSVLAQAPAEPAPPILKVSFSNNNPKTGDVIEVIFKCDIPAGFHLYSTYSKCEFGPLKFVINFDDSKAFCKVGELYSVGDKHFMDEIFKCEVGEFFNKAEFRQKIKVIKNTGKISGTYEGQWCTESTCFNFGMMNPLRFSAGFTASGKEMTCDQTAETPAEPEVVPADTAAIIPANPAVSPADTTNSDCPSCNYKLSSFADTAACVKKTFNGQGADTDNVDYWGLFLLAFLSGLVGLLTPCVFPMIPMTVAFFTNDKRGKLKARLTAMFFGLSIIFIYTVLGTIVAFAFGADAGNVISTHWLPNILFFVIFIIFAFSFFGAFEIVLPSSIANKADREADKGGYYGAFFMALTLAIVSFSCTGPIVGNVLVKSAGGEFLRPVVAMFGFGLAFALPFTLFALFPSWLNSLPKSGGWLNSVKVCIGFLELAFALKFLSIADQTYHWHILNRDVYLALWIIIFGLMGLYLLGKLKFAHDSDLKFLKVPRLLMGVLVLSFVVYMIPGLWGAPLKYLSGYLPPMSTQEFDINRSIRDANGLSGNICKKPSYADKLHLPHGLNGYYDYDEAVSCSKELKKPLFIDFTGHGCVNCRKMEEMVWSDPRVLKMLREEFVIASLYVDDKTIQLPASEQFIGRYSKKKITTLGKKNAEIEICYFGATSQPLYCLLDGKENLLQTPVGSEINKKQFDTEEFLKYLENGLAEFKKRNPNP
jgi:thiol:disulfide interchange protein DsbD